MFSLTIKIKVINEGHNNAFTALEDKDVNKLFSRINETNQIGLPEKLCVMSTESIKNQHQITVTSSDEHALITFASIVINRSVQHICFLKEINAEYFSEWKFSYSHGVSMVLGNIDEAPYDVLDTLDVDVNTGDRLTVRDLYGKSIFIGYSKLGLFKGA